ncbi:MAG: polysaccharide export protein, partial [Oscillospiraceae bacterium]|nr:polysaccharide export protein [Oscillospiraceae bacterium]
MDERKTNNYRDDEIDLIDLFFALKKHVVVIALCTFICGVLAFAFSKLMITPLYESTSKLYILTRSTSITSLADIQIGSQLSNDYEQLITSRTILEKVIKELDLDMNYLDLSKKVSISNPSDTRIINITVKDPDPYLAKDIADALADISASSISEITYTDPPTVYEHGYVADRKSYPSNSKNAVIGALIGFLI